LTTPAAINNFAKNISAQVRSADFDKIYQAIQSHDSLSDKKKYLNFAFQQDPDNQYPMLDASYYQGINGGNANNKLFRVKDGNDYMFKPDSTVPTGVKAVAVAINLGDLGGEDSRNIDYASVSTHLQTVFGKEVFYNLLVQAAMDSMRQSEATRAAIKAIGKINVYDRR
jgi:hypothetical protein